MGSGPRVRNVKYNALLLDFRTTYLLSAVEGGVVVGALDAQALELLPTVI